MVERESTLSLVPNERRNRTQSESSSMAVAVVGGRADGWSGRSSARRSFLIELYSDNVRIDNGVRLTTSPS
jgi:hypothetical protein